MRDPKLIRELIEQIGRYIFVRFPFFIVHQLMPKNGSGVLQ